MKALIRKPNTGYLDNWFWVPKSYIDVEGVKNALSLRFPDAYSETKIRFVYLWRETETHLLVPRCLWQPSGQLFRTIDCRPREYAVTGVTSRIKLDHRRVDGKLVPTGEDVQQRAMDALLRADSGVLQLGCGKGKTVIALDFIARRQAPAIIVLDNTNLLEQWRNSINELLDVPGGVGLIQGDKFDWKKSIVLATYQTLGGIANSLPEEVRHWFGTIVFDEGHHISAVTFAPAAEVFPGMRLALTATPIRDDGLHIIYDNHVGPVIYKDITHTIKPRIVFKWTGVGVDATSPVYDRKGNVHLSMVSSYFGKLARRLQVILRDVDLAVRGDRKVLVLCNSVDEAINLCSLWTQRSWENIAPGSLYTDIPTPVSGDVGHDVIPCEMEATQRKWVEEKLAELKLSTSYSGETAKKRMDIADLELRLAQDSAHRAINSEMTKREKRYREWLMENLTSAGLMIHKVDPADRMHYVRTKQVIFGITKYGKEGLDDEYLDTVLVSTPFASRNGLQQTIGRPTRQKPGKKYPLIVFYEDNISTLIGMCKKLRTHLNAWSPDEGGPFEFEMHDHPHAVGRSHRPIFEHV